MQKISLSDPVFAPRQKTGHDVTIPSCINKCEETGRLQAYRLQWRPGDPATPHIYWDSDVAKVLEGMAEMLTVYPDEAMATELERLVDLVISAQQENGFLNVHFTVVEPGKEWRYDGGRHELYCAGHLFEAAVAHFKATGSRKFLDAMCRYADYIDGLFGNEPGKMRGYPGHEEIELALVKLYRATGEKRYLKLAKYFVDERGTDLEYYREKSGKDDWYFKNMQAHKPVRQQEKAEGHAVRAVYLYSGMVDVALETGDTQLLECAKRLFDNIVDCKMYITGGIGSTSRGEQFTMDYDLPGNTAYAESCAAIGMALLAKRLLDATGEVKYADVLEKVLYNNCLSGISLAGNEFFYANMLEVNHATLEFPQVDKKRQQWFGCSCCPTNYCRFLPQIGKMCYAIAGNGVRIDVPAAGSIETDDFAVAIQGGYPYDGAVTLQIQRGGDFQIALRIPSWCDHYSVTLNGAEAGSVTDGYWRLQRNWQAGDCVKLTLEIKPVLVYPNTNVTACAGKTAIQHGPLVYCLESVDNPGVALHNVVLPATPAFITGKVDGLPPETVAIRFNAQEACSSATALYHTTPPTLREVSLCAIPYALWQNRGESAMQVFLRTQLQ